DAPGDRLARVRARLRQRARHSGAVAAPAGDLRLRRIVPEPVPRAGSRTRAGAPARGGLPGRDRPRDRQAPAPELRRAEHLEPRHARLALLHPSLEAPRARRRDRRHRLQPVPGEGPPRRLPDLRVGLGRRLPRPRELPLPALGPDVGRAEHRELREPALRRALPRDEEPPERCAPPGADPRDARGPRARAAVDRAHPPRGLHALPALAAERQAGGALAADRQVRRPRCRAARAAAPRAERADPVASLGARGRVRAAARARRADLPAGAAVVLSYLTRRSAYGAVPLLGVLALLFALFFVYAQPEDIARRALGEKAPPEALQRWIASHGYDRPRVWNPGNFG